MKNIIILTGNELRHEFFRKFIASNQEINVLKTFCEGTEKSLRNIVEKNSEINNLRIKHLVAREQSEKDFFELFTKHVTDKSNPEHIGKGEINAEKHVEEIIKYNPDILISYGCSIIKEPLLSAFSGRFINAHLGLSPYYRGSGTNYWPLVNNEPEFVGVTFMHIDAGIDTGDIIHQIRARYSWGDTPAQIGNRLIFDMAQTFLDLILNFDRLEKVQQPSAPDNPKLYKNKDYTEESVAYLYENFHNNMIERYISEEEMKCNSTVIFTNPAFRDKGK